jgi:heme exporter protein CcmD
MSDPNSGFVIVAYIIALVVIGGMIVATFADYASLRKSLEKLAARTGRAIDEREP